MKTILLPFGSLALTAAQVSAGLLAVGPDYQPPTNAVPAAYKAAELGAWKAGRPLDHIPKGSWWETFRDPGLDELEAGAGRSNQNLRAAVTRVGQARAAARLARVDLLPRLSLDGAYVRYRQQVLVAFGEVETSLAAIRHLAGESAAQQRAVDSARHAADLAAQRYRSGIVSYLELVDANRELLQAQRGNAQLIGTRLNAAVQLIKALGGGWETGARSASHPPKPGGRRQKP